MRTLTSSCEDPRPPVRRAHRGAGLRRLVTVVLLAVLTAVAGALPASADQAADDVSAAVNAERASAGLGALTRDPALDAAAVAWARQMGTTGTFAHASNAFRQSYARAGWSSCCGENIAAGYSSAGAVMGGWMSSSGHAANILGSYTHIGVGHVSVAGSPYTHYWVQVFASYPFDRSGAEDFVRALYRDLLGRTGSSTEVAGWVDALGRGMSRQEVATAMTQTPEWIESVITRFYQDTLGREPDAAGLAGWVAAARSGMPVAQIAAAFYGSPEYFARVGGDRGVWVRDLYDVLLFRAPDAAGVAHWLGLLEQGTGRDAIAYSFYQSRETGRVRVESLYRTLLGRTGDAAGVAHWTPIVLEQGDLALAAWIASSEEYYLKAGR
ncbi:DUF4214 domain-containing protein [Actinotalea sp.]|uniref:DUF4214 domain-containing protein n=1 Tax=Actinotalea sp. TaxID=1872145 RepID=UPI0035619786